MDFMPDVEFHVLFFRVSIIVSLMGCTSTNDINKRLKKKIKQYKRMLKENRGGKGIRYNISQLKKLLNRGFARRTINEAIVDPNGMVALTLLYGRKKAEKILLARARKRLGPLRTKKRRNM